MRKTVSVIITICFVAGFILLSGCGPSTRERLEQKTQENQELTKKVADLEKEVKKLQDELSTCQEDFKKLLYYNAEK